MTYLSNIRQEWYLTCTKIAKRAVASRVTVQKAVLLEKYSIQYYSREYTLDDIVKRVWRDGEANAYKHRNTVMHYLDTYEKTIKQDYLYFNGLEKYPLQKAIKSTPTIADWKNMTEDEREPYNTCCKPRY